MGWVLAAKFKVQSMVEVEFIFKIGVEVLRNYDYEMLVGVGSTLISFLFI